MSYDLANEQNLLDVTRQARLKAPDQPYIRATFLRCKYFGWILGSVVCSQRASHLTTVPLSLNTSWPGLVFRFQVEAESQKHHFI